MKGYKGFNKGLVCKNKQYQENTVFEEDEAVVCHSGMHFCPNPLDVLQYYSLIDSNGELNEFTNVEALDECFTDDNKKYTTRKLKIGAKLNLKGFIEASFEYLKEKVGSDDTVSGDYLQVATSGNYSQVATSGNSSQVATSGNYSQVATSGNSSQVATSGDYSQVATSGDYSQVATSGYSSQVATSGYSSRVSTSGNCSQVATSGNYSQVSTSGDNSQVATPGNYSQVATSGNYSRVSTSGNYSQVATSGDYSRVSTSGNNSQVSSFGDGSIIANIGVDGIAKAKKGSWITLAEYTNFKPICVKTEYVDGVKIKENTWYHLVGGEFKERVC